MRRLRITVIDLVTRGPSRRLFSRLMNANYASIMPQAVAVWAEQLGHEVRYVCFTGNEDVTGALADATDVLVLGAFTRSALAAYAISQLYRRKGAISVLGGPHARCYPEDAARYFDYVLGFTGRAEIEKILRDPKPQRPVGSWLSAARQPSEFPGVRERWKYIEPTLDKAPTLKLVPMLGSVGCPYTCRFCIDSTVDYQPLGFDQITEDLRFLAAKRRRPIVGWHDPNFGVRFDDYMTAIEAAVPPGRVRFVAESSLSLLSKPNLERMAANGFIGMLPGIESWYEYGNKSKSAQKRGAEKVLQVSEHVNEVLRHIPYVQTNFVLGLDCDEGTEPFELTKQFLERSPGAFPAFSLFTSYGRAAPLNRELQAAGRVLPFPFHFLDSNHAMNVRPAHYSWSAFYELAVDLARHALSRRSLLRRFRANRGLPAKSLNLVRGASSRKVEYQSRISRMLAEDISVRRYFEGETTRLPDYYRAKLRGGLGNFWELLPEGALEHDQNAYFNATSGTNLAAEASRAVA